MPESNSRKPNHSAAADYWKGVKDPQNLDREGGGLSLADEVRFADAPDLRAAAAWLEAAPPGFTLDLGAGLGANAFALAQRGHRMIAADTSLARLRLLRGRALQLDSAVPQQIHAIVAAAETLPFRNGSLPRIYTKSVLIHTDLRRASDELARVLTPAGRAAFVEPQPGNPFAWFYRRFLGPKAWAAITRYFDPAAQAIVLAPFGAGRVRPFYGFSFLAFVFQFAFPAPMLFFFTLAPLHALDRLLFTISPLRRLAWFGVICVEKPLKPDHKP